MTEHQPICLYDIAEVVDCQSEAFLAKYNPVVLDAMRAARIGVGLNLDIGRRTLLACRIEGCNASCAVVKYDKDFFYIEDPESPDDGVTPGILERECRLCG